MTKKYYSMLRQVCRSFCTIPKAVEWTIRSFDPGDADQIKRIAFPVLHDLVSASPGLTEKKRDKLYQTDVQRGLSASTTKVLLKEGIEVGGFITYHLPRSFWGNSTGIIEHLVVDPRYSNQGLGSKLLNQAVDDLKSKGARVVTLRITSEKAVPFYTRNEFKVQRYPDFRWGNAGSMVKLVNPSNRPILGPLINRVSIIDNATLVKRVLWLVFVFTLGSLSDQNLRDYRNK